MLIMKNNRILFIFILALCVVVFWILFGNKKTNELPENQTPVPLLSYRQISINRLLENPEPYDSAIISNRKFFMTTYRPGGKIDNHTEFPYARGGVILFEEKNGNLGFFWESKEFISDDIARFEDVNNDGIDEIIVSEIGSTGQNLGFWIYAWQNNVFRLITPTKEVTTSLGTFRLSVLGGDISKTRIEDIDGDNVFEIIIVWQAGKIEWQRIYKWNGEKYYLWEEKKLSEEERLEFMNDWKPL